MMSRPKALQNLVPLPCEGRKEECRSVDDSFRWAHHGLARAARSAAGVDAVADLVADRVVYTSSACSGVAQDTVADASTTSAASAFLQANAPPGRRPISFVALYAIDKSEQCIEELLAGPSPPQHVFKDLLSFLPNHLRKPCGLDGGTELSVRQLKNMIPKCKLKATAWCYKCGDMCAPRRADLHRAGTPCPDYSAFNNDRPGSAGSTAKVLFVWVAQRRQLKDKVVVAENVPGMGLEELRELLGDMYVLIVFIINCADLGWSSSRKRQCVIMILKVWGLGVLRDAGEEVTEPRLWHLLDIENTIQALFFRPCSYS